MDLLSFSSKNNSQEKFIRFSSFFNVYFYHKSARC